MPIEDKYTITPDMITKDMIDDWLNDSVGDSYRLPYTASPKFHDWSEFIARRLNAAIRFGLVKSRKQFDDAVDQDYCTICGKILDGYEAQAVLEEPVAAKNVLLHFMERGTKDISYHESIMSAACAAYWAIEDNTFMPVSIEENGVVVWASDGEYPELESLGGLLSGGWSESLVGMSE